jgi:SAM-dependent methyltransferase
MIPGTEGYEAHARALIPQYEAVAFEHKYAALLHLLPTKRAQVLDIGAGAGGDAAWFVARGHTVVAVEPVAGFRRVAMDTHRAPCIEWVDDHLPLLTRVCQRGQCFDLVSLMAVWMHLNAAEREAGMGILAGLLAPDGVLLMSLRHGPVPSARRMFAVSAQETIALQLMSRGPTWRFGILVGLSPLEVRASGRQQCSRVRTMAAAKSRSVGVLVHNAR